MWLCSTRASFTHLARKSRAQAIHEPGRLENTQHPGSQSGVCPQPSPAALQDAIALVKTPRGSWCRCVSKADLGLSMNVALTPALSHPMGEGEAFQEISMQSGLSLCLQKQKAKAARSHKRKSSRTASISNRTMRIWTRPFASMGCFARYRSTTAAINSSRSDSGTR